MALGLLILILQLTVFPPLSSVTSLLDFGKLQPKTVRGKQLKKRLHEMLQDASTIGPGVRLKWLHDSMFDADAEVLVAFIEHAGIDRFLDQELSDHSHRTPLSAAIGRGSVAMVETLLRKGVDPNLAPQSTNHKPLYDAILRGNKALVGKLVAYGAYINGMATSDMTMLDAAKKQYGRARGDALKASMQEIIQLLEAQGAQTYEALQKVWSE